VRRLLPVFLILGILAALAFAGGKMMLGGAGPATASVPGGGADSMSVDADPTGQYVGAANTDTSLSSIQNCLEIFENNLLDFDEDGAAGASDKAFIDVTIDNVPPDASNSGGMIAYSFNLSYPGTGNNPPGMARITAKDTNGLLSTAPGYNPFAAGDPVPDSDGNYLGSTVDLNAAGVQGSGFLERDTVESLPGLTPGVYSLNLTNNVHIDTQNTPQSPTTTN